MDSVKKNYVFSLIFTVFNILFPIISFPLVAKVLGPEGVGKVQFILSFAQYFALIAGLGIPIYGSRVISQAVHDPKILYRALSELVYINIICSIVVFLMYLVTIFSFSLFDTDSKLYLIAGMIVLMRFTSIDWYFAGIANFRLIAIRSVVVKLLSLLGLYFFVKDSDDYNLYLGISIFSILGNNIVNLISIRNYISFKGLQLKQHIRPLMYTFGTTIAVSMYTMLDTVLIGILANERSVGLYSASIRLTKLSIPVIISAATVLMPKISLLFKEHDFNALKPLLNKSFNFIAILSVPASVGLLFLAPELILAFSSSEFHDATLTMQLLSPLTIIIGLGYFWGFQVLTPAGKDREMLFAVLIGMTLNLGLNFTLIPRFRQDGAAVANIISELAVTLAYMYFCFRLIPVRIDHRPLLRNLMATFPFIGISLFLRTFDLNVYVFLVINLIFFGASYFLLQATILNKQIVKDLIGGVLKKT